MKKYLLLFCFLFLCSCASSEGSLKKVQARYPDKEIVRVDNYIFAVRQQSNVIRIVMCYNSCNDNITHDYAVVFKD